MLKSTEIKVNFTVYEFHLNKVAIFIKSVFTFNSQLVTGNKEPAHFHPTQGPSRRKSWLEFLVRFAETSVMSASQFDENPLPSSISSSFPATGYSLRKPFVLLSPPVMDGIVADPRRIVTMR